jgi:hypothetical protein
MVVESMPRTNSIRALKPNVTREEAIRHFTAGPLNLAARLTRGPVRSIAELYIPFRWFRVSIVSGGRAQSRIFALDAVDGTLDLFEFLSLPGEAELCTVHTRNVLPVCLDSAQMQEQLIAKLRRIVFAQGFFKVRDLEINAEPIPLEGCVPYWLCFREAGETAHLSVFDAVRRKREGAKVRHMIETWLRSESNADPARAPAASSVRRIP